MVATQSLDLPKSLSCMIAPQCWELFRCSHLLWQHIPEIQLSHQLAWLQPILSNYQSKSHAGLQHPPNENHISYPNAWLQPVIGHYLAKSHAWLQQLCVHLLNNMSMHGCNHVRKLLKWIPYMVAFIVFWNHAFLEMT